MSPADSPFAPLPAPGAHPATAELRAYAAGTLSPAEEHRIEAHALDCERCAELVEGFSMSDAPTTDRALAELHTRLHARVAAPDAAPVAPVRLWPRLAAAAALAGVVAAGLWGLDQREANTTTAVVRKAAPRPEAPAPADTAPAVAETSAAPSAPPPTAAPTPAPAPARAAAKEAAYATTPKARSRRAIAQRAARRPAGAPTTSPAAADMVALADAEPVDKLAGYSDTQKVAAVSPQVSANENAGEVVVAPTVPDASKMLKQQVAIADSATAQSTAKQQVVTKAKARLMGVATPALSGRAAGRVPVTAMPPAPAIRPAPVGGMVEMREYIRKASIEFEPEARTMRLTGYVHVKFIVGADGKLSDFKVTRGLRDDYDAEAIRIISEGPAWQPGVAGGRRAPLPMEITVPF